MGVWMVIWVVLMMFWLFGGAGWAYNRPAPDTGAFIMYGLVPFLCVLLLGLMLRG